MKVTGTHIKGVYIIDLEPREDERGYFSRVFCKKELADAGISFDIVQINRSFTNKKGTIRGMHYQKSPYGEDKIVQCLRGEIFDVAVDIRKGSVTFGEWVGVTLNEKNMRILVVPKGCAHGFQAVSAACTVEYFVSQYYTPEAENGIRWDDPEFSITWPVTKVVLSPKDAAWPLIIHK